MVARHVSKKTNGSTGANRVAAMQAGMGAQGGQMPRLSPNKSMGVSGISVYSGYVRSNERNAQWTGPSKWQTIAEIVTNISIVAASVQYFLNMVAHPKWTVRPADDADDESVKLAEFVEEVIHDMTTPWSRVVRRAAMYRFNGFGLQEWIAKKRKDGKIGLADVESRPSFTVERWEVDADGSVNGVWQRSPQTFELLPLPRGKLIYLVDDTLTDQPDGLGVFRHLAEPYTRLKQYLELEMRAFERDMRGIPVGRAPISLINQAVNDAKITKTEGEALIKGMRDFIEMQVRDKDTSILMDSQPYENQTADGLSAAGVMQWDISLLSGGVSGLAEMANAVDRLQREMARIIGTEHLMMGDKGGNRALAVDKSRNLYLIANSVLSNIADGMDHDLIEPLWTLNGFDDEKRPYFQVEDVAFKDAAEITTALASMATAGAVLAPNDPAIDDVRDILGIARQPEATPEQMGLMGVGPEAPQNKALLAAQAAQAQGKDGKQPTKDNQASNDDTQSRQVSGGKTESQNARAGTKTAKRRRTYSYEKFNQNHDDHGRFSESDGSSAAVHSADPQSPEPAGPLVFHGTSEAVLASIQQNGLVPALGTGWGASEAERAAIAASGALMIDLPGQKAGVFFASSPVIAMRYAAEAAKSTGSVPVILPVHLDKETARGLVWDKAGNEETKLMSAISPNLIGKPAVGMNQIRAMENKWSDAWRQNTLSGEEWEGLTFEHPSDQLKPRSASALRDIMGKADDKILIFAVLFVNNPDEVQKYNPNHDDQGRFADSESFSVIPGHDPYGVQGYAEQAMRNLGQTSRTAQGTLDLTNAPGKEDKMVAGLTGDIAARQARENFSGVIHDLYWQRSSLPDNGPDMEVMIDRTAESINEGIVKPGEVNRSNDTKIAAQTKAIDLPIAKAQFARELVSRLRNPDADPIETAAWVEWRANMIDHYWSDGVGKTSKALAALPLMRAGLPLPNYPDNKTFFSYSPKEQVDPRRGGSAYLGADWRKFNDFYHTLVPVHKFNEHHDEKGRFASAESEATKPVNTNATAEQKHKGIVNWLKSNTAVKALADTASYVAARYGFGSVRDLATVGVVEAALHAVMPEASELIHAAGAALATQPFAHLYDALGLGEENGKELLIRGTHALIDARRAQLAHSLSAAGHVVNMGSGRVLTKGMPDDAVLEYLTNLLDAIRTYQPETVRADDLSKFNHNHDERGRFAESDSAGGGGAAGSYHVSPKGDLVGYTAQPAKNATELYNRTYDSSVTPEQVLNMVSPAAAAKAAEADRKLADTVQTQTMFQDKNGQYIPERKALHDKLLNKLFTPENVAAAMPASGEQPTLYVLGGRGGAGKSWFSKSPDSPFDAKKTLNINSDDFKEGLPEYQGWNAGQMHEESSDIASQAHSVARSVGANVTYDATLRSTNSVEKLVDAYQKAGYRVEGYFMHTAPQVSAVRSIGRFMDPKVGRYVPASYVLGSTTNEKSFDALTPKFAKWAVYDNNSGTGPKLVAKS